MAALIVTDAALATHYARRAVVDICGLRGLDALKVEPNSLLLLKEFKARHPKVPTKSGLMVGLGETDEEILEVMREMRAHDVDMLTIGQYLQPSGHHLPVMRFVHPDTFAMYEAEAMKMGFAHAACGPMVRSSYHADQQAHDAGVVHHDAGVVQHDAPAVAALSTGG